MLHHRGKQTNLSSFIQHGSTPEQESVAVPFVRLQRPAQHFFVQLLASCLKNRAALVLLPVLVYPGPTQGECLDLDTNT